MKLAKEYENYIQTLQNQQSELDKQLLSLDQANTQRMVVEAQKSGRKGLNEQLKGMNPDEVQKTVDDVQDYRDQIQEINVTLLPVALTVAFPFPQPFPFLCPLRRITWAEPRRWI